MVHIDTKSASAPSSQEAAENVSPKKSNLETIPKLLRAIAGGENAKASGHDVIFREAAAIIENQTTVLRMVQGLDIHHTMLAVVDAAVK